MVPGRGKPTDDPSGGSRSPFGGVLRKITAISGEEITTGCPLFVAKKTTNLERGSLNRRLVRESHWVGVAAQGYPPHRSGMSPHVLAGSEYRG